MLGELIGEPDEQARQAALIAGALLAPATAAASPDGAKLTISVLCADGERLDETLVLRPHLSAELVRHAVMRLRQRYESKLPPDVIAAMSGRRPSERDLSESVTPPGTGAGFIATREGGFAVLEPLTASAEAWLRQHTSKESSWDGDRLAVELRYWPDLADAIIDAGFKFEGESRPN